MEKRSIYKRTWDELSSEKNMILLTGPRQAGKTTLSDIIAGEFTNHSYLNWDISEDRQHFIENPLFFKEIRRKDDSIPLIVLDEIHKYKDWKNYLKGVYDGFHKNFRFLISGSGRLDTYQKGADSLAGRYYLLHLWPLSIAELGNENREMKSFLENPLQIEIKNSKALYEIWHNLAELSGFPEPYLSGRKTTYRRWSNTYSGQLIREDIRDLTGLKSIVDIETLYMLLPSKIGSALSIPSLARDLKTAYNSIQKWISTFESFFLSFSITPWSKKISRAIQKERKLYLWDSPRIKDPAVRFENMVALELYRAVTAWNDMGYGLFSLHYIKNKEHQEVDFLIANEQEPLLMIEAKLSDSEPSPALKKFQTWLDIPAVQLIAEGDYYKNIPNSSQSILLAPAYQWLAGLP